MAAAPAQTSVLWKDNRRCLPSCRSRGGQPPLQLLKEGPMSTVRHVAAWAYRVLITLFAAAVIGGLCRRVGRLACDAGREHAGLARSVRRQVRRVCRDRRSPHRLLASAPDRDSDRPGRAVLDQCDTRASGSDVRRGGTGENAPVAGAFHAVNAVLVLGLALFLTVRAWRGSLPILPAQLRRTASAPMPAALVPVPAPVPNERVQ